MQKQKRESETFGERQTGLFLASSLGHRRRVYAYPARRTFSLESKAAI